MAPPMYFPVAQIDVAPWLPPAVAFGIAFFGAMGGVSGAFLLLPFQISVLGFTGPAVSATNHLYNVVAIPGGVYRYLREGRMLWPLAGVVAAGTLPGALLGVMLRITWLADVRQFRLFVAAVLAYIGLRMLRGLLGEHGPGAGNGSGALQRVRLSREGVYFSYGNRDYHVPGLPLWLLSLVTGVVGGIYGIGGGALMAPLLVSIFGLPVHVVAGAALLGTFLTSLGAVVLYQLLAPWYPALAITPDWALGALFGLGGMAGTYLGARCQRRVPERAIRWLLTGVVLLAAGRYLWVAVV